MIGDVGDIEFGIVIRRTYYDAVTGHSVTGLYDVAYPILPPTEWLRKARLRARQYFAR